MCGERKTLAILQVIIEKIRYYIGTCARHKSLMLLFLDVMDIVRRRTGLSVLSTDSKRKEIISITIKRRQTNVANVQGHIMCLDKSDSLSLGVLGIYEPAVTRIFKENITNGCVVLDIGAHIGYYTLIAARLVGKEGHVFAFEPNPTNFGLLKKNVEINGYTNVTLVQKAISNKTGKAELYLNEVSSGGHSIFDPHDGSRTVEVDVTCLDDYFKDYGGTINFIKMDIEGAEALAIQGMSLLLAKNQNVKIITEFSPCAIRKAGITPEGYLKSLIGYGFKLYDLDSKVEAFTIEKLMRMKGHTNLLCVRRSA